MRPRSFQYHHHHLPLPRNCTLSECLVHVYSFRQALIYQGGSAGAWFSKFGKGLSAGVVVSTLSSGFSGLAVRAYHYGCQADGEGVSTIACRQGEDALRFLKRFKKICVFCGSSSSKKGVFSNEALTLGRELVNRKIDLVYGGGSIGLMGQVAQSVKAGGGHVVGVIPKALIGAELTGNTAGELIAVTDMHQRKAEMFRQADAFIALPGGYGTLEELVEVITWNQLGIHKKPVGLLNVDGFYDTLLTFFDKQLEEQFFDNSARSIVVSAPTASELLDKLESYSTLASSLPKLCWEVERACGLNYTTSPIAGLGQ